jgi:hypothetical protein
VTGAGVSGNDMPSSPWTGRKDVSPAEDTPLDSLLAGNGLPAGAGAELRPVADVLAALTANPGGDELTGLAAARDAFSRRVAVPAQMRQSRRWRSFGLVSRLGVRLAAVAAVVALGFGGAAAAAYAGALPTSWQQFAHRTIGAPVHRASHDTGAETHATGSAAHRPSSRDPAYQAHSGGQPAGRAPRHRTRTPLDAGSPSARPFMRLVSPTIAPSDGRLPPVGRSIFRRPARTEQISPDPSASNAGSVRGVS